MKLHIILCTLILANTLNCASELLPADTRITIDLYTRNLAENLTAGAQATIQSVNWSVEKHDNGVKCYKSKRARLLDQASRTFRVGVFPPNSTFYFVLQDGASEPCMINSSQFNVNEEG